MKVNCEKIVASKVSTAIDVKGIALLSIEEYDNLKHKISRIDGYWWLRSPGYSADSAACVFGAYGRDLVLGFNVSGKLGVRPALHIGNPESSSLQIGDRIEVANYTWTIISDTMALCDDIISDQPFREDWKADNANDYEASDIKRFLEDWWNRRD